MGVEQVTDVVAYHGEGPVWSPRWGGLGWVDMLAGDVLSLEGDDGAVDRKHVGAVPATSDHSALSGTRCATTIEEGAFKEGDGTSRALTC